MSKSYEEHSIDDFIVNDTIDDMNYSFTFEDLGESIRNNCDPVDEYKEMNAALVELKQIRKDIRRGDLIKSKNNTFYYDGQTIFLVIDSVLPVEAWNIIQRYGTRFFYGSDLDYVTIPSTSEIVAKSDDINNGAPTKVHNDGRYAMSLYNIEINDTIEVDDVVYYASLYQI